MTSTLGHDERRLGSRLAYCASCKQKRPPNGWQKPCPVQDRITTPLVVPIPTSHGRYRGPTKPGG